MSTQPQTRQPHPIVVMRAKVAENTTQISEALPRGIGLVTDQFVRAIYTCINETPNLAECPSQSFINSAISCAQTGLLPGRVQGKAYLVPRRINGVKTACFQISARGYAELAYRASQLILEPYCVFMDDTFDYDIGAGKLVYKPNEAPPAERRIRCGLSVAVFPDGRRVWRVCPPAELEVARAASLKAAGDASLWNGEHEPAMVAKTALLRHTKYLPTSPMFQQAVMADVDVQDQMTARPFTPSDDAAAADDGRSSSQRLVDRLTAQPPQSNTEVEQQQSVPEIPDSSPEPPSNNCEYCGDEFATPYKPALAVGRYCSKHCANKANPDKE